MEHDEKFWLTTLSMVFTALAIMSLGGCAIHNRHVEKMAELGYQQVTIHGSQYTLWQKVGQ